MAVALRVLDGGWKQDEAHVEALAFTDEVATEADAIYDLLNELESAYRLSNRKVLDPRWRRAQWKTARLQRRAAEARAEIYALIGGGDAA